LDLTIQAIDIIAQKLHQKIPHTSAAPPFALPTDLILQLDAVVWNGTHCPVEPGSAVGSVTVMMMNPGTLPAPSGNVTAIGPNPLTAPSVTILYDNLSTLDRRPRAYKWGRSIGLCENLFAPGANPQNIAAVLFHELVHICGGNELDAEAFETFLFSGTGATDPDLDDWEAFRKRHWRGHWVHLTKQTNTRGAVKNNFGGALCTFDIAPSDQDADAKQQILQEAPSTSLG